jgi:hypothetical protein
MALLSKILGSVAVPSSGTRVQITPNKIGCSGIIFQASSANSGKIYVGDITVTSSNGVAIGPGESFTLSAQSIDGVADCELILSDYYVDADTNGNTVRIHYLTVRTS